MARKRMIDPHIWQSEDFSKLSVLAKLVFIGMFSNADDEGRGPAKAAYIKSVIFPYDENMRASDIDKTLDEIASNMSAIFYKCNGNEYYSFENWKEWQKIDRPQPSNIKEFDDTCEVIRRLVDESSTIVRGLVAPNRIEENITEKKVNEKKVTCEEPTTFSHQTFSLPLQNKISEWLQYKKERKEDYKPTGLNAFLSDIENKTKIYSEAEIIKLIGDCMANNWKGIIWDRLKDKSDLKQPKASNVPNNVKNEVSGNYDYAEIERLSTEALKRTIRHD